MEIADSARKHGISDEDIHHALSVPMRLVEQAGDRLLVIGPARNAQLLEIIVLEPNGQAAVIHADILRPKFYRFLR